MPVVPAVGGEGDVVGVDDGSVGADVAHVAGGVERGEVGALLLKSERKRMYTLAGMC